jgi:hypothetical protein
LDSVFVSWWGFVLSLRAGCVPAVEPQEFDACPVLLTQPDDVGMPVLKKWRIFERNDFTGVAAKMRDDLELLVDELSAACAKFEVSKQRHFERGARRAERLTAKLTLETAGTLTLSGR